MKLLKKINRKYKKAERFYTRSAKLKFRLLVAGGLIAAWQLVEKLI